MSWTIPSDNSSLRDLVCSWTADGSGNVSDETPIPLTGYLVGAYFVPGSSTPTDLYDFELRITVDDVAIDILRNGSNISNSAASYRDAINFTGLSDWIPVVNKKITAVGSNCGAATTGTIHLMFQSRPN